MLQLVEMEGKMTENGCIEIPAVVLEQAGICTGDTVKLVYMAEDGELKNTAKEFLLARAGQDVAEELAKEENIAFQIPEELLRDAGIPMDADLDIVCQEGINCLSKNALSPQNTNILESPIKNGSPSMVCRVMMLPSLQCRINSAMEQRFPSTSVWLT